MHKILPILLGSLLIGAPALGAPDHEAPGHGTEAHGDAGHGDAGHGDAGHGDADHGDAGHGEGGAHGGHHYYTDDDDGDGIPNWRDATTGFEPNTETYEVRKLVFHAFNLIILLAGLGYFLRRPLKDTLSNRALGIRKELTDSARRRDEAHQRHQDLLARLDKIEQEVQTMHAEAESEANKEEQKLIERAEREAIRIAEQAQRSIRDEATRARTSLRREAVELAVQLAEETLRNKVSSADQRSLAQDFLSSLESSEGEATHG